MGIPPYECQSAVPTARVARVPTWKLAPLTAEVLGGRRLWFGGRFVLAVRNCCFRRFEASSRVGSVAERLGSRAAAAAQRKRTLGNRVGGAVPINRRHIITLDEIGSVLNHLDRCHLDVLRHCPCHRNNLAHTEQARALSPSGTIGPGQVGWIRHWFGGVAPRRKCFERESSSHSLRPADLLFSCSGGRARHARAAPCVVSRPQRLE